MKVQIAVGMRVGVRVGMRVMLAKGRIRNQAGDGIWQGLQGLFWFSDLFSYSNIAVEENGSECCKLLSGTIWVDQ